MHKLGFFTEIILDFTNYRNDTAFYPECWKICS